MAPPTITKIPDTEWEEVVWANGTRYFFNPYSRESVWETPPEVEEARKPKPVRPCDCHGSPCAQHAVCTVTRI